MKSKNIKILSLLLSILVILSSLTLLTSCSDKEVEVAKSDTNYVNFTDEFTTNQVVDEETAIKAVESVASQINISDPSKELKVEIVSSVDGDKYYRMQQYYKEIPVYGCSVVVGADENGNVTTLTANTVKIDEKITLIPTATVEKINETVVKYFQNETQDNDIPDTIIKELSNENLVVYDDKKEDKLAYVLNVGFNEFIIDAHTAKIITVVRTVNEDETVVCYNEDATKQFDGYYVDNTSLYTAYNKRREIKVYNYLGENSEYSFGYGELLESSDKFFGNVVNGDSQEKNKKYSDGVTYINNMSLIYDYFNTRFSDKAYGTLIACYNDGFDDGGNALGGRTSDNQGYVSMGSVTGVEALDTMAHEYTHVVSRSKVNWVSITSWTEQTDEPGAINEAYSDIFGELIESEISGSAPDWEHGNRIIHDPMSKNYPAAVGDKKYEKFKASDGSTKWGMLIGNSATDYSHGFSTIISHSAYLMWNGIDGTANKKLSAEELAELWYRGLLQLQSNATFKQCANAVISSAQQMYRSDPNGFNIEKVRCVEEAFKKVGITANATSSVMVENGATIYAIDATNDKPYNNYHIKIEKINLTTRSKEVVTEADVTNENGYKINLPEDTYIVSVTDNAENGSEYEFSKTIKVFANSEFPSRNPTAQPILNKKVNIYTNFKAKIYATDFEVSIDEIITLGELGVIEPTIIPADADAYSIKWSSSDESVATVSPNGEAGIITTLAKGTTTITAELTSGGKTITKTTNLRVASKARDTVLVLDVSGSMYGDPLEEMKKSAIQFCNDLLKDEYNNRVGIVFYDDGISTIALTDDLNMLVSRIQSISDGGRTNMEAGLSAADNMLKNSGKADSIKNVVVMADGLPNEGKTSYSGSMPSGNYSGYYTSVSYANAVIDTAKQMMNNYNLYSLGFFHGLYSDEKDFATALMKELTNQTDGYHQVDKAEDLQFAFGDISEDINVGSKIVINIACPVDVRVSYGGEMLSSSSSAFCNATSFGTLQLLGKNKDIKVVSLDGDKEYEVELIGTGVGKMDYSVNYFNEKEQLSDYRSFETVPITMTTVIKSNTDNSVDDIALNIDEDGDGEIDVIWTALAKSKGEITYEKNPPEPEEPEKEEPLAEEKEDMPVWAIVLICVFAFVLVGGGIVAVVVSTKKNNLDSEANSELEIPEHIPMNIVMCSRCGKTHPSNQPCECWNENNKDQVTEEAERSTGFIQVTNGSMNGFSVPIKDGETLYLGKDPKFANLVFTGDYKNVSRMHCAVTFDAKANRYYVTDSSSNGTYLISKKRLIKGKRTPVNINTVLILANDDCTVLLG